MERDQQIKHTRRIYEIARTVYGRKMTVLFDAFGIPEGVTLIVGDNPTFDQAERNLYETITRRAERLVKA